MFLPGIDGYYHTTLLNFWIPWGNVGVVLFLFISNLRLFTFFLASQDCLEPYHTLYFEVPLGMVRDTARQYSKLLIKPNANPRVAPQPKQEGSMYQIAYMSSDYRNHPLGRFMQSIFKYHDRSKFYIHCIALQDYNDDVSQNIKAHCNNYVDVSSKSNEEVIKLITDLKVDILIDLNGWTQGRRPAILAARPAPVVAIHGFGYPGTFGAEFVDYFITDSIVTPESHYSFYTETLVVLPVSYQVTSHRDFGPSNLPQLLEDYKNQKLRRSEKAELPDGKFVFGNFQTSNKFTKKSFIAWMKILNEVPESVLWLLQPESATAASKILNMAISMGIKQERIIFAPHKSPSEHIERVMYTDLFLDTDLYGAHTTATDALWADVPMITIKGDRFSSRVGASILTAMDLEELIVDNFDDYVKLAVKIAKDKPYFNTLKNKITHGKEHGRLFDSESYTRDLESGYVAMWNQAVQGVKEHIHVKSSSIGGVPKRDEL
eukprot:TRINITY_DN1255_c1_g1_i2.p1 TRINITY_DN1255_c1_g1~~TRINITY_DN1255_c1_g1_i2.p1  ORF type:complete len:489 (+),score=101.53 TRINITY_DN1255_c1_g1_i2:1798-3264(+)